MGQVRTTLFTAVAIVVILFIIVHAQSAGAPSVFTAVGILMIVVIVILMIRAWLRL